MTTPVAIVNKFETGPKTYEAKSTISAGQAVQYASGSPTQPGLSFVEPAGAASQKFAGVATRKATDATTLAGYATGTSPDGYPLFYAGRMSESLAIIKRGEVPMKYAAAANYGDKLKCAANGTVTPWVFGTDDASLIIGTCQDQAGVAMNATGMTWISAL